MKKKEKKETEGKYFTQKEEIDLAPIYLIYDLNDRVTIAGKVFLNMDDISAEISKLLSSPDYYHKTYYIVKSVAIVERKILPVEVIKFKE